MKIPEVGPVELIPHLSELLVYSCINKLTNQSKGNEKQGPFFVVEERYKNGCYWEMAEWLKEKGRQTYDEEEEGRKKEPEALH
jgi:hypothetical protein